MENTTDVLNKFSDVLKPFPVEWISKHPDKVENALAKLSVEDQIRYAAQLRGSTMQGFINLSPNSQEIIRGLPQHKNV